MGEPVAIRYDNAPGVDHSDPSTDSNDRSRF